MTAFLTIPFGYMEAKARNKQDPLSCSYLVFIPLQFEAIHLLKQVCSRDDSKVLWLIFSIAMCLLTAQQSVNLGGLCWSVLWVLFPWVFIFQAIALTAYLMMCGKAQPKEKTHSIRWEIPVFQKLHSLPQSLYWCILSWSCGGTVWKMHFKNNKKQGFSFFFPLHFGWPPGPLNQILALAAAISYPLSPVALASRQNPAPF